MCRVIWFQVPGSGSGPNKAADCGTSTATSSSPWRYDPSKTYYGYFDPNKCYYSPSRSNFQESSCNCSDKIGNSNCISGNLLNWITTTRVDIARWVLTGGRKNPSGTFLESEGAKYTINDDNLKCKFEIGRKQHRQQKPSPFQITVAHAPLVIVL